MEHNSENLKNKKENTPEEEKLGLNKTSLRRKLLALAVVAIVVTAAAITAVYKLYEPPVVIPGCKPGDKFSQTTGEPCKDEAEPVCKEGELFDRNTGDPCIGAEDKSATPGENFQELIASYAGHNIVLDGACVAAPKLLSVALNTKILIANNSQKILEVIVQGKKEVLPPYRSLITTPAKAGTFPVTCNSAPVAVINVK